MTDKQNYEKDINIPHKEQIIIDGVDVSGCKYYKHNDENSGWSSCISKDEEHIHAVNPLCCEKEDCLFKQLARNTQECDRYREALEEIEKVCIQDIYTFADGTQVRYDTLDDILDIINKAKGDN